MERLTKRIGGFIVALICILLTTLQSGCTSTSAQPTNAFQPRPFQSRAIQANAYANQQGYAQQQAFYSPYAQQSSGLNYDPNQAGFGNSQSNLGLDLNRTGQYQQGYQNAQASPWRFGLPNVRSFNPLGFAGTSC